MRLEEYRVNSPGDISYLSFGRSDLDRPPEADNRFVYEGEDDWVISQVDKPAKIVAQQ